MSVVITLVVVGLAVVWAIGVYKKLTALRGQVIKAWKQLDAELKRRHDLTPRLVNNVRGAMEGEPETVEAVMLARNRAAAARGPADAARSEGELTEVLRRLIALAHTIPEVTANHNVRTLHEELEAAAHKIGVACRLYNDIAARYNAAIQVVPNHIVAGLGSFKPAEPFEIGNEAERAMPH